jgi:hypothetical protein
LRIGDAGDGVVQDSSTDVDRFDGVTAQRGDEQAASAHGEVIEAAFGVFERDGFGEDEWLFARWSARFALLTDR